jgi:hypothetical protein
MMKRVVLVVILELLVFSSLFAFSDVPKEHWAYRAVTVLSKLGIMSGYPDGTFRGNETVSRYQLAKTVYNVVIYIDNLLNKYKPSSSVEKRLSELSDMVSKSYKWSSENLTEISKFCLLYTSPSPRD